jgi:riboflavin kinase/FMN adenylyltransferase
MKMKKIPLQARVALAKGEILEANKILGEYYSIQGTVVKGNQLGRTLGFPTANLQLKEVSPLFLANGVYAVKIKHENNLYDGMINIGIRPTLEQHELTIEVNLFDFNEDLYGQELTLFFIDRIRDEMKFPNLEALKHQIFLDKQNIIELFHMRNQTDSNT